ncbi:MAG TPA: DUF4245 domain-containing protein [Micromonosporaceae bacterium]|nr:DUF4245 domain-containing protein [Micromonosporaceae bacterium]
MQPTEQPPEPVAGPEAEPATRGGGAEPPAVRSSRTPRDMALSLIVLLVPVLLLVGAYRVLQDGDQPIMADVSPAVAQARSAGLVGQAPPGLPPDWRATSARFRRGADGSTLRIGYVTPSGGGLQLVRSDAPTDELLARELGDAPRITGTVTVGGDTWQRYVTGPGGVALVCTGTDGTALVIGRATDAELTALAGAAAGMGRPETG